MTTTQTDEKIFLKPGRLADGSPLAVRKPTGQHLSPDGEFILNDSYWRRRVLDGDVVAVGAPAEPSDPGAQTRKPRNA